MTMGPGKYDDVCTYVRKETNALVAAVIVFNGDKGSGFSIQAPLYPPELGSQIIPEMLEHMARVMRDDTGQAANERNGSGPPQ